LGSVLKIYFLFPEKDFNEWNFHLSFGLMPKINKLQLSMWTFVNG
jgi:hypothetical protein